MSDINRHDRPGRSALNQQYEPPGCDISHTELKSARYDVLRFGAADLADEQRALPLPQAVFTGPYRIWQAALATRPPGRP
ncbi:hypothetical protein ACFO1B_43850 [Dactylosporangium siamense]|uniref:Uncharacterized protein n=1 Tax=Dactylosporangium siamense TaxID=685454 RepID=A0A919UI93_9ACTN|nr:hypothetical protein [Dactylosporangium siamense]GIG53171.1 hypothetical protein Dsi01nite_112120 [Dactylosporangium siamense]